MVSDFKNQIIRVPYTLPYVSLVTKASILYEKKKEFAINVWNLNKNFYQTLGIIYLKDVNYDFQYLMSLIGFKGNALLEDICDWHIKNLQ